MSIQEVSTCENRIKNIKVNPKNSNQLWVFTNSENGLIFTIFDPSGSHGAENFFQDILMHQNYENISVSDLLDLLKQLTLKHSSQYQIMDIQTNTFLQFHIDQNEEFAKRLGLNEPNLIAIFSYRYDHSSFTEAKAASADHFINVETDMDQVINTLDALVRQASAIGIKMQYALKTNQGYIDIGGIDYSTSSSVFSKLKGEGYAKNLIGEVV